ncbi:MAG: hypothetical protein COA70_02065 [Planctomycetota bacterium]|nr:MAG: hypothetical protein COA70_02065 [Planctomycetota bacterium]
MSASTDADEDRMDLSDEEASSLSLRASKAFRPSAPISARSFFAGRWDQLLAVVDAVAQPGLHIVVFGERGVGKTSLANMIAPTLSVFDDLSDDQGAEHLVIKVNVNSNDDFGLVWDRVFREVSWDKEKPTIGFAPPAEKELLTLHEALAIPSPPSIDDVKRVLKALPASVIILDEFDRIKRENQSLFTDLIKLLSDYSIDSTVVLVGVSETVDDLVQDHASIVRAVVQIPMPRMNKPELIDILGKASEALDVVFEEKAMEVVITVSQGLPHYTHLLGLNSVRAAAKQNTRRITEEIVQIAFDMSAQQALQTIREKHLQAVHSARRDALYSQVAIACAVASSSFVDALGFFHPSDVALSLADVLGRPKVGISTFQRHLSEFCEPQRGPILKKFGQPRAYKYRFIDPLMPTYIFIQAVSCGLLKPNQLFSLTAR